MKPVSNPASFLHHAAASILFLAAAASLYAAPVIYEPFDYDTGAINGKTTGASTGLSGNWDANGNVVTDSLVFGSLPASTGNKLQLNNQFAGASVGTSLSAAGLLDDDKELWFSFLVRTGNDIGTNGDLGFALGTHRIGNGNNIPLSNASGSAIGVTFKNNQLRASSWLSSLDRSAGGSVSPETLYLVVGRFTWGATEDVIDIYNVSPDLTLGSIVSTRTVNVDQSAFTTVSFGSKGATPEHWFDDLRFGASAADVLPVDTVPPTLLSIQNDQLQNPIGEDVVAITYDLTFDKHMDLTTITGADFENAGDATTTIGTINQPTPGIIRVQFLPTTTGTVQLRILSGSVLSSLAGVDLDTTSEILDPTIITIDAGPTTDTGIRYWDGAITSGITDGVSQGGNGTWNTSNTNWDKGAGFAEPVAWDNANLDTAILGGANGTISLGTGITAGGITSSSAYTISGANTLTLDVASGTPVIDVTANTITISSNIAGTKGFQKTGGGTLLLTGDKSFSGGLTMSAGTLQVNNASGVFGTGTLTVGGGQIRANQNGQTSTTTNNHTWNANFQLSRGGTGTATWNFEGDITLGANVTVTHADNTVTTNLSGDISDGGNNRVLTLAGNNGSFSLSGDNTHGGGTTLNAGTLRINSASAIGTGTFTIAGGTIDNTSGDPITLSTNNVQAWNNNITFTGTNDLNLGTGAVTMNANRTVTVNAGTLTVGGNIGQSGGTRTLGKAGNGTLVLSGANSYAGNTTVSAGTLALVGGSQNSAITVNSGASLGFTLGSPTTSTKAVTLVAGHAIVITGTVNNTSDYQLMTATGFTGTPVLSAVITDYELELRETGTELWLTFTGAAGSPYDTWASDNGLVGGDADPDAILEADGLTNLQKYAFGLDPNENFTGGSVAFVGTDVTNRGLPFPLLHEVTGNSVDFRAVFGRRKDYIDADLVYTVQFSAGLDEWITSVSAPTLIADQNDAEIEVVFVPYPLLIETTQGFVKPRFFRVGVEFAPVE